MKNVKPYQGLRPYIFLSYSHKDEDRIEQLLQKLQQTGCNIWYDEGITPTDEWADTIAKKLSEATVFFVIISENSIASQNVKREIYYAVNKDLPILTYYLDDIASLPAGLDMQLGISQAVKKSSNVFEKIVEALPESVISDKKELIFSFSNFVYYLEIKEYEFSVIKSNRETLEDEILFKHKTSRAFDELYYAHSIKYSLSDEFHSYENDVLFFSVFEDLDPDLGTTAPYLYVDYSFAVEKPNSDESIFHFLSCKRKRKDEPYNPDSCELDLNDLSPMFRNRKDEE